MTKDEEFTGRKPFQCRNCGNWPIFEPMVKGETVRCDLCGETKSFKPREPIPL